MRLILIINFISPHRIHVFNYLAKKIDLKVILLAETENNRKWKIYKEEINFNYKILKIFCFYIQSKEMPIYFNWGLWRELRKFKPDAICICGYHYLATIEALIYMTIELSPKIGLLLCFW